MVKYNLDAVWGGKAHAVNFSVTNATDLHQRIVILQSCTRKAGMLFLCRERLANLLIRLLRLTINLQLLKSQEIIETKKIN